MKIKVRLKKRGNSFGFLIPKKVIEEYNLMQNEQVLIDFYNLQSEPLK